MARPTPSQLREARDRKKREEELARQRAEEERLQKEREEAERRERQHRLYEGYAPLDSATRSLYIELDKLTKKAPKERVTDLNLRMMNDMIRSVKALIPSDPQLQSITIFEAAGDNPEYRDALLVVGQVRAALERLHGANARTFDRLAREPQLSDEEKTLEALIANDSW